MRTIKVYEVLADTNGEGPAGDGTKVFRFRSKREAETFAKKSTCYGTEAKVTLFDAPPRLAARWGLA